MLGHSAVFANKMPKKEPVKRFHQLSDKAKALYKEKLVEAKDNILLRGSKNRKKKQAPQKITALPPVKSSIERAKEQIRAPEDIVEANLARLKRVRTSELQSQVLDQLQKRRKLAR